MYFADTHELLNFGIDGGRVSKQFFHDSLFPSTALIIHLQGTLGSGKTTFSQGFLKGLGYDGKVKSPTFSLVEPYEVEGLKVYHMDWYRLTSEEACLYLGFEEYFEEPKALCLIEWPEMGKALGFSPHLTLHFHVAPQGGREVNMESHTPVANQLLTLMGKGVC